MTGGSPWGCGKILPAVSDRTNCFIRAMAGEKYATRHGAQVSIAARYHLPAGEKTVSEATRAKREPDSACGEREDPIDRRGLKQKLTVFAARQQP